MMSRRKTQEYTSGRATMQQERQRTQGPDLSQGNGRRMSKDSFHKIRTVRANPDVILSPRTAARPKSIMSGARMRKPTNGSW